MTEALELQPGVSDGELARAAAEGDRHAFAEIYDRYADRLYDFCVGLIGDRDAAADCVQDAFCAAATDLGNLREPDKLRPWLYSIARHHAMRRLRHRYREEVSDELPDMVSHEANPEMLAGQSELARLVADAAGGLSDRDRELLDLSYRHGLDGPELAETLGVTLTSANTMMFRLRQTVERCLGALLVARGAQANPQACPELAEILKGWDGQFTVLMRKRMARHIDSCETCEQDQRRYVNPVALLGGAPVFIPAPGWLRRQTLDRVQLTCASSSLSGAAGRSPSSTTSEAADRSASSSTSGAADPSTSSSTSEPADRSECAATSGVREASGKPPGSRRTGKRRTALMLLPLLCLCFAVVWFAIPDAPAPTVVDTGVDSSEGPLPAMTTAIKGPPTPVRSLPPAPPTPPAPTAPRTYTPGPAPAVTPPGPAPSVAPASPPIGSTAVPDAGPPLSDPIPEIDAALIDTAPPDNPSGTKPKASGDIDTAPKPRSLFPNIQIPRPNNNQGIAPKPNLGIGPNQNNSADTNPNSPSQ